MTPFSPSLGPLVWTQLWQVTAVAAVVGLVARLCCRQRPHLAYVLWLVVLVKSLTPPLWSSPTSLFSWAAIDAVTSATSTSLVVDPGPGQATSAELILPTQLDVPSDLADQELPAVDVQTSSAELSADLPAASAPSVTNASLAAILGIAWLIGAAIYATCATVGTLRCWRAIQAAQLPPDERLAKLTAELARRLDIRRPVRLCVTRDPIGPLTYGWLRPTVVMPQTLAAGRSLEELEPLLAHELVHVRRGDALVALLQLVMQCLWWFHPLIWWANRRLICERERACDEEVVASLSLPPARYARGLLGVLELKQQGRWPAVTPGIRSFEINRDRLQHIMLRAGRFRRRMPLGYWLAAIAAALLVVPGAGLSGLSTESPEEATAGNQSTPAVATHSQTSAVAAEMHVVGVYRADGSHGSDKNRVDVEVRPTDRPVVLVLTSYNSVDWHVKLADGARVKQAIVFGYNEQDVAGLPADVPVINRSYMQADGSVRREGWFYAWQADSIEYRKMVDALNDMTGLLVSTAQLTEAGESFVIDGKHGADLAQQARRAKPTNPEPTPTELLAASAGAELHIVGHKPGGGVPNGATFEVEVLPTGKPIVLTLTAYSSVLWKLKVDPRAQVKAVIISGYNEQEFEGLPADVPVVNRSYYPADGSRRKEGWFTAYQPDTIEYRRMVDTLNDMTGLLVSTAQLPYRATSVIIDGQRGSELAQKERRLRPAPRTEATPEQLLAASAGAELHLVSLNCGEKLKNGAPVQVEVRPTGKPIVLVLASYMSVLWQLKIDPKAEVKAAIIGGYYEQQFEGLPADVPLAVRTYFPLDRSQPRQQKVFFYSYQPNTIEYRKMVEQLSDMTGLVVATAQVQEAGTSFVVDGKQGASLAQTERKAKPAPRRQPTPEELLALSAGADLQVVGIYQPDKSKNGDQVEVEVRPTDKPIVLALTSYMSVLWNVKIDPQARVKAVIIGGFNEQQFEGIPADIPLLAGRAVNFGYELSPASLAPGIPPIGEALKNLTGLPIHTFQGTYSGSSFVVDGKRGRGAAAQADTQAVDGDSLALAKKKPAAQAEAADDVADIPSKKLKAGDDAKKAYFLIGPKEKAEAPSDGFHLLVVLPGGDGGADFHPFVKRIYKYALADRFLVAQPIAMKWSKDQQITWPTNDNPVDGMKFSTEEFVKAVIDAVADKHKINREKVFSLSWSSGGPVGYALGLEEKPSVTGSFVAMSVFNPEFLPPLAAAKGRSFYIYHCQQDQVCPYSMAEEAKKSLGENGAKVELANYPGGHGWTGPVYPDIRKGIAWLENNGPKAEAP